jgi:hypothetical protein
VRREFAGAIAGRTSFVMSHGDYPQAARLRKDTTMKPEMERGTFGDGQLDQPFQPAWSQEKDRNFIK